MEWFRSPAREGETSRIRTSSGSYTIIGTMSGAEGKTFGLFNSAGQPLGYRRTQRDAKALAEDYAATAARKAHASPEAMGKFVADALAKPLPLDEVSAARAALQDALDRVVELEFADGDATRDEPDALMRRIVRRVQYDTLIAVRRTGTVYAEHAIAEVAEELSLPLPEGDPVADPAPEFYSAALREMDRTVNGWIEGAMSNHDGMGHRGESEPCWTKFSTEDIRNMIKDTARTIGVPGVVE